MKVSLTKDGKVVDDVKSYTAFRKNIIQKGCERDYAYAVE